jgi:hypothetical protein
MPKINQRVLNEAAIPMPSCAARDAIVEGLGAVRTRVTAAKGPIREAEAAIEKTYSAFLSRVFRAGIVAGCD